MQDAIKHSGGDRNITDRRPIRRQLSPFFQRPVGGQDGGMQLVPTHNDLKEVLARLFGQFLDTHIVDNQQIRFQITVHDLSAIAEVVGLCQIGDGIKDGKSYSTEKLPLYSHKEKD